MLSNSLEFSWERRERVVPEAFLFPRGIYPHLRVISVSSESTQVLRVFGTPEYSVLRSICAFVEVQGGPDECPAL